MKILSKKKNENKSNIYFNSTLGNINIFFIDKVIHIPENVTIYIKNKHIFFKGFYGVLLFDITTFLKFNLFKYKNKLILILELQKKKKSILHLYYKLFIIKIKGVSKNFKLHLLLKGIGFKVNILPNNNILQFKLGFSHTVNVNIPKKIKIINQINLLICNSNDLIILSQFIHFMRKIKQPEPYKGKGLLLKNEVILLKEGKKSKK